MQKLQSELRPSEYLLWNGRPKQGIVFVAADLLYIPFSLLWLSLTVFSAVSAFGTSLLADGMIVLFGAVGLYGLIGRFLINAFRRKYTHYGITNQRVLVLSGIVRCSVRTIEFESFNDMDFIECGDGSGLITTNTIHPIWRAFVGGSWPITRRGFPAILNWFDDVKLVFGLIREAASVGKIGK